MSAQHHETTAGTSGSENSELRRANLRRYWSLKNAEQCDHVPTGHEHRWGERFAREYPQRCASCGCHTRSPFDSCMIIHDVDECESPNPFGRRTEPPVCGNSDTTARNGDRTTAPPASELQSPNEKADLPTPGE